MSLAAHLPMPESIRFSVIPKEAVADRATIHSLHTLHECHHAYEIRLSPVEGVYQKSIFGDHWISPGVDDDQPVCGMPMFNNCNVSRGKSHYAKLTLDAIGSQNPSHLPVGSDHHMTVFETVWRLAHAQRMRLIIVFFKPKAHAA